MLQQVIAEKEQQLSAKETTLQTVMAEKNQIIDALLQDLEISRNTISHFENRIYGLLSERQQWEDIANEKTRIINLIVDEKTHNYAEKDKAIDDLIQQRTELTQQYETALQKHNDLQASIEDLQQRHDWVYQQWKIWENIAEQRRLKTRLKKIKDFLHCELTLKAESATYRLLFKNFLKPLFTRWGKNNLAVVTRHDIFPVDHGAAAKIYHTARVLSFDYKKVFLITGDREKYFIFENGQMSEALYPRRLREKWYPSYETLRDSLTVKGVPEGESFLFFSAYDANFKLRVLYLAWLYGIQVYQAEFPSYLDCCKWALNLFGGKTCVVEHNVEYRRVANTYGIRAEAEQFLKAEEVRQCNAADFVIAVSHDDKRLLIEAGVKAEKITMIPHGVDLEAFDNMPADPTIRERYGVQPEQILLMFHGIYSYRPNAEAVEIIGHTILPKLNARGYYPKCLAVGKYPPPSSNHPDLTYTGVVDSVAPYVKAADIAVVPLQDGGGTRMKILEYFAAAVPVIATAKGAEGIVLERERDILIRDEIDDLVDAIILLIEDKALRQKIGQAGRQVVEQMDWKNIGKRYVALFNQKA